MSAKFHAGAALAVAALFACAPMASAQQQPSAAQRAPQQRTAPDASSAPSEIQQVRGRILDIRQVPIRGVKARNTLALIRTPQGNKVVIDLGDRLPDISLQQGQLLQARGRVVDVENRRTILLADAFRYGGLTYDANRVAFLTDGQAATASAKPVDAKPAPAAAKPTETKTTAPEPETAKPSEAKPTTAPEPAAAKATSDSPKAETGATKAEEAPGKTDTATKGDAPAKTGQ